MTFERVRIWDDHSNSSFVKSILLLQVVFILISNGSCSFRDSRPNVLLVVWDTVRADHLSIYGYEKSTTPFLQEFVNEARVFDDCTSPGSTTVPSHASIFTGLYPQEIGVSNESPVLEKEFDTLAEILSQAGYDTYMFSENPYIAEMGSEPSFTQGFHVAEHPWSDSYFKKAVHLTLSKFDWRDNTSLLADKIHNRQRLEKWNIKSCGELALDGLEKWLSNRKEKNAPFFAFINYMEAHAPLLPTKESRHSMMTPEEVELSFHVDRRFAPIRLYTFNLREYSEEDVLVTKATYDAVLLDLDRLFGSLIERLNELGFLNDNTIVVLTGDHGEHLGEHHMLDHQFSVYEPLMRVPLIVYGPRYFKAGRENRPVSTIDLFLTILELAGIDIPPNVHGESLLDPRENRLRYGEYNEPMYGAMVLAFRLSPDFDVSRWNCRLSAFYKGRYKLVESSCGDVELYDLKSDPDESTDLSEKEIELKERLKKERVLFTSTFRPHPERAGNIVTREKWEIEMLKNLGYVEE